MLKEFIQHIQQTTQPTVKEIGGETFVIPADGRVKQIEPMIYRPDTLLLHSLDALVKLVKTEALGLESLLYITIPSHLSVLCFARPNCEARFLRQVYYDVKATDVPGFCSGFREHETAIIELRSQFTQNEGTEYILDLLSRISKDSGVTTSDNGVSQSVEARQGVSLKAKVPVQPRVSLRPYRTFQEVEQPESEFLLRLDDDANVGLFEADGGMWKLKARETIKEFLSEQLKEEVETGRVIIAL